MLPGLYIPPVFMAGGSDKDPFFANVVLLLHMDGADGSTTFVDSSPVGRTVTPQGNAQIDTAQWKLGVSSLRLDGSGDRLVCASSTDFNLPGDFTFECFVRAAAISGRRAVFGIDPNGFLVWVESNRLGISRAGIADDLLVSWTPSTNTWYHIAVSRTSNTMRVFIDGTQLSSGTVTSNYPQSPCYIGGKFDDWNGWIDELRLTKGVGRYTSNFTVPTKPYPDQ